MQSSSNRNTPWQRLLKLFANPMVEVLLIIAVFLVSAWVVIESESAQRKGTPPILVGH